MRHFGRAGGFTLIELAIVLIISGLIISAAIQGLKIYERQQARDTTIDRINIAQTGLREFLNNNGRYPRPASFFTKYSDGTDGREVAAGASGTWAIPVDKDGDGKADDRILIGALPYATMLDADDYPATDPAHDPVDTGLVDTKLRRYDAYDAWGSKLTYAVTESLTDVKKYNDLGGAIDIRDEHNVSVLETPNTAHLVVLSHGENKRGAYSSGGQINGSCALITMPGGPPPDALSLSEITNCRFADKADNVFLSGLRNDTWHSHNDDILTFKIVRSSQPWSFISGTEAHNTYNGFVGVGTDPSTDLHVLGTISADNVHAGEVCDDGASVCMHPETLGGNDKDMQCPSGTAIAAIGSGKVNNPGYGCVSPAASAKAPVGSCSGNQVMTGISGDGTVICSDPP
jgi:prepilin-type N-terminal cleavage/methylation domain-containing protein